VHNIQNRDSFGRPTQNTLKSDSDGPTYTAITYDSSGRTHTVSNPYRSTSDPTYGLTTYTFDVLGRSTVVAEPDGSSVKLYYGADVNGAGGASSQLCAPATYGYGYPVLQVDEAGKKMQTWANAFGETIEVDEPNSSGTLSLGTCYTYDALSNLTGIVQMGGTTDSTQWRQRTFVYDSLSRLTSATEPESGTITYSYDANSNLISKTSPAPNQTGTATLTTTYTYDALNRLTSKVYNNGSPAVYYYYDQAAPWGVTLTNPIGRLTTMGTYDGMCWPTASTFGYDAMGRLTFQEDYLNTAETSGCPGNWTSIYASYDLAGNQTSLTYPSGRVIKSKYNGASRLTNLSVDDLSGYNYLSSANYSPFGSPTNFALGNGAIETTTYNNRLQPLNLQVKNGTSTMLSRTYGFGPSGQNNGNVLNINDNLNSALTQNFSYDSLNRLSTAQTTGTSGPNCWGQQFGYDAWGNLLTETPNVSGCPTNMLSLSVNANNQITNTNGSAYDAAGNMRNDGTNGYTYDAENHLTSLNSGAATYIYDAQGRRMAKKFGSATTEYIHFNGDVLAEYNVGDLLWNDYIFAGGRRLAAAGIDDIFNPGFEQGLEGWRTWAGDSSGSEQVITDATRAHSGKNYLQLSSTTAQVVAENQVAAVNPGDQLTFGGWVYLEPGSATGGYVGWNIGVLDANGNALAYDGAANVTSGAWTYQSVNYTVPTGGASVFLYAQIIQPSGLTTARFDDAFLTGASGLGVHYYHADHLGSARLMTDASGNQSWSANYLPFGLEWNPQPTTNHYKFTGYERDTESGLDNASARHFSSAIGRFLQPDPLSGYPENYSYVYNNPLNLTDPSGMCSEEDGWSGCDWGWDWGSIDASAYLWYWAPGYGDLSVNPLTGQYDPTTGFMQSPGLSSQYSFQQMWNNMTDYLNWTGAYFGALNLNPFNPNGTSSQEANTIGQSDKSSRGMGFLAGLSNFSAGAGDCLTGRCIPFVDKSVTQWVRGWNGADAVVNKNSGAYLGGEATGGAVGSALMSAGGATLAAIADGKYGAYFGRAINNPLFNGNALGTGRLRFGWNWIGDAKTGRNVIRLGIGAARGTKWWNHIVFWSRWI
jgi:RHS repeat-associated protein